MGAVAGKMAGIDELKKDVADLKKAAELMRSLHGQLEGKVEMVNNTFGELVKVKGVMDNQIGNLMQTVNTGSSYIIGLKNKVVELDNDLENIKKRAGQAKQGMEMYNQVKGGDYGGAIDNAAKNFGMGGFGF